MTIQNLAISRTPDILCSKFKPLVLVVDDDEDNLLLLQYSLELFNYRFSGRKDGINLVSLTEDIQPNVILLDIVMPKQSGVELLHQLRGNVRTCQIPVVAITALGRSDDRLRLLAEGFDDYLSKPFALNDLQTVVEHYCYQTSR
jgi:CheY-like chemotaxis protein